MEEPCLRQEIWKCKPYPFRGRVVDLNALILDAKNARALVAMVESEVEPEDVENKIAEILYYLERTKPEEADG